MKVKIFTLLAGLLLLNAALLAGAGPASVPELMQLAARNQDESLAARDRSRYEQMLRVEKFKPANKPGEPEKYEGKRDTVVVVEPATTPDETGNYLVTVRVIQDSENDKPKKVDPNARTLLSVGKVWDEAFFPLLPEKIEHYLFDEIVATKPNERMFRFTPKVNAPGNVVLAMGTVTVNAKTGHVLTIRIDGLKNLGSLDKHLNDLRSFTAVTDYSEFEGKYRFPTFSKGVVMSDISRFKGKFHYTFEEGKYIQVLAVAK